MACKMDKDATLCQTTTNTRIVASVFISVALCPLPDIVLGLVSCLAAELVTGNSGVDLFSGLVWFRALYVFGFWYCGALAGVPVSLYLIWMKSRKSLNPLVFLFPGCVLGALPFMQLSWPSTSRSPAEPFFHSNTVDLLLAVQTTVGIGVWFLLTMLLPIYVRPFVPPRYVPPPPSRPVSEIIKRGIVALMAWYALTAFLIQVAATATPT